MSEIFVAEPKAVQKVDTNIGRFFKVIQKEENEAPIMDYKDKSLHVDSKDAQLAPGKRKCRKANKSSDMGPKKRLFPLVPKDDQNDRKTTHIAAAANKTCAIKTSKCPAPAKRPRKMGKATASPRKPKNGKSRRKAVDDVVLMSYSDFLQNNAAAAPEKCVPKEDVYQYDSNEEDADVGIVKIDYRKVTADKQKCITKYFSTITSDQRSNGVSRSGGRKKAGFKNKGASPGGRQGRGRPPKSSAEKLVKCNGRSLMDNSADEVVVLRQRKSRTPKAGRRKLQSRGDGASDRENRAKAKPGLGSTGEEEEGSTVRRSPRVRSQPDLFNASTPVTRRHNAGSRSSRRHQEHSVVEDRSADVKPGTVYQVAVINETGGKQCIRLRLTRVGQQSVTAKFTVGTAQRLLNKAKQGSLNKETITSKKPVKRYNKVKKLGKDTKPPLAEIFVKSAKKKNKLPKLVDEAFEQKRQNFLMSGIPEKLRKQISNTDQTFSSYTEHLFPSISHVQQRTTSLESSVWLLHPATFREAGSNSKDIKCWPSMDTVLQYGSLTNCADFDMAPCLPNICISSNFDEPLVCSWQDALSKIQVADDLGVDVLDNFKSYQQRRDLSLAIKKSAGNELPNSVNQVSMDDCSIISSTELADAPLDRLENDGTIFQADRTGAKRGRKGRQEELANKKLRTSEDDDCVIVPVPSIKDANDESAVPDSLWTSVYRPRCARQILGNKASLEILGAWLAEWKTNVAKSNFVGKRNSKSNDKGLCGSEEDSDNADSAFCNTVLLRGASGSGKTSAVYALAEELGYTVLEVNASSRRSGKHLLNRLREATQSHQVKETSGSQNAIALMFSKPVDQKGQNEERADFNMKNSNALGPTAASGSLILIEDVDVIFSDDDGFWTAVNTFMASAKIPIILTTCDLTFGEKGCIRGDFKDILFSHPDPRLQVVHLQLLSLAESQYVNQTKLSYMVRHHQGNFRQAVNTLQYMLKTEAGEPVMPLSGENFHSVTRNSFCEVPFVPLLEAFGGKTSFDERMNLFSLYEACGIDLVYSNALSLLSDHVVPRHSANTSNSSVISEQCVTKKLVENNVDFDMFSETNKRPAGGAELVTIRRANEPKNSGLTMAASLFETSSMLDSMIWLKRDLPSLCDVHPGLEDEAAPADSSSNHWDRSAQFDIVSWLQSSSYSNVLTKLVEKDQDRLHDSSLGSSGHREESNRIAQFSKISETKASVSSALPVCTQLNRGAVSLDYLPCLRTICRAEKEKLNCGSIKRGGRYSHYLCSSVLYLDSTTVKQLGDELQG